MMHSQSIMLCVITLLLSLQVVPRLRAQTTVMPTWTSTFPGPIRAASANDNGVMVAVDSSLILLDPRTGIEISRFPALIGTIDGLAISPAASSCYTIETERVLVEGKLVSHIVEYDVKTGVLVRKTQLRISDNLKPFAQPDIPLGKLVLSGDGKWLHSCRLDLDLSPYSGTGTVYDRMNVASFAIVDSAWGHDVSLPWGSLRSNYDGSIVQVTGSSTYLVSDGRGGYAPRGNNGSRIHMYGGDSVRIIERQDQLYIAAGDRCFHNQRDVFETTTLLPIANCTLAGTIDFVELCSNGKHYFSRPYQNKGGDTFSIRELTSQNVVYRLKPTVHMRLLSTEIVHSTNECVIMLNDSSIIRWEFGLEPAEPARLGRIVPDTVTASTFVPVHVWTVPIGTKLEVVITDNALRGGGELAYYERPGQYTGAYTLVSTSGDTSRGTYDVEVFPLPKDPRANRAFAFKRLLDSDNNSIPSLSPDGRFLGCFGTEITFIIDLEQGKTEASIDPYPHPVTGCIVDPNGTLYTIRDSLHLVRYGNRGEYSGIASITLRSLSIDAGAKDVGLIYRGYDNQWTSSLRFSRQWDSAYHWIVQITRQPIKYGEGWPNYTLYDGSTGEIDSSLSRECSHPLVLGVTLNPLTREWNGFGHFTDGLHVWPQTHLYSSLPGVVCDSIPAPLATAEWVANGEFLYVNGEFIYKNGSFQYLDGEFWDRSFKRVGPDTAVVKGKPFANRPYLTRIVGSPSNGPSALEFYHIPDGKLAYSVPFTEYITGIGTDADGIAIAISFADGTVQIYNTDSLLNGLQTNVDDVVPTSLEIQVAPQPSSDEVRISIPEYIGESAIVQIVDINGSLIRRYILRDQQIDIRWDGRSELGYVVPSGVYSVVVSSKGLVSQKSVVIIR
ncbi:MAG: hypothetical protein IPF59_01225 [Ignavibacteria bacterium]|nr:hypothetical protein [Ignavibacteria bacterium]MBK6418888.1 hypothetical protein [Ignavibacteria bacterium]MBK7411794.1 hypothetical protein [Ignavibacteria bacterium]